MKIFEHDDEPEISRSTQDLNRAFELLIQLPDDFLPNGREQLLVQECGGL